MRGKVIHRKGDPKSHIYTILGDDGLEYFAHVGDLSKNEQLVYQADQRDDLNVGEVVDFEPFNSNASRAIHVKHEK